MKNRNKILIGLAFISILGIASFSNIPSNASSLKAEEKLPINKFDKIASGWNPNASDFGEGFCQYVLEFTNKFADSSSQENLVSKIGNKFTLDGVPFTEIPNSVIYYAHGGKYFAFKLPTDAIVPSEGTSICTVKIEEETPFYNYYLQGLNFYIDTANGYQGTVEVSETYSNKGIFWNRENKDPQVFGEKEGLLVKLSGNIYDGTSDNLVSTIGDSIKLNDTKFSSLTNPEIRVYNSKYLWFYADEMTNLTLDINTFKFPDLVINGHAIFGFTYYCEKGEDHYWSTKVATSHTSITLNEDNLFYSYDRDFFGSAWPTNHVYEGKGNHEYCGGNYKSSEKNGFLLSFATRQGGENIYTKLSKDYDFYNGGLKYVNLAKEEIGHHIKSNGVPFCDIEGAELMYHSTGNIWLWTPDLTEPLEDLPYAEITIDKDTKFFDSLLPEIHIIHEDDYDFGNFSKHSQWHIEGIRGYTRPTGPKDPYLLLDERTPSGEGDTWLGPYTWNNHCGDGTTIIAYGHNAADDVKPGEEPPETTYLSKSKVANGNNLCSKNYSIGYKLKLNGVPLYKIPDTTIAYLNAENFFTFIIPEKYCIPFNGYKIPTLTLDDKADFHDVSLQGFTIYWNNGIWQKAEREYITDTELNDSLKFEDIFNEKDLNKTTTSIQGNVTGENRSLSFEFKATNPHAAFAFNVFGSNKNTGINVSIDFSNQSVVATDKTKNSKQISDTEFAPLEINEWTRGYINVILDEDTLELIVGIDDATIIHITNYKVEDINGFGNVMNVYGNGEDVSFRNPNIAQYIKRPDIIFNGKLTYRYHVGDTLLDFSNLFSASNLISDISDKVQISYPEGMFDKNKKLNKGVFSVIGSVTNDGGSTNEIIITVIVTDPNEAVVTFDYENPTTYKIGDKVTRPLENPTKESEFETSYEFLYWVNENTGIEWDFENDYVTSDLNLVAVYKEITIEYTATFNVTGLKDNKDFTMKFIEDATINKSNFDKDGYTLKMVINGEEVESYTISKDTTIELKYTEINPTPETKGCGGSVITTIPVLITLMGLALSIVLIKRKVSE